MKRFALGLAATLGSLALLAGSGAVAQAPAAEAPAAAGPAEEAWTAERLARHMDTLYRADASRGRMRMTVATPDYERTLEMDMETLGTEYTLIRIRSPKKEAGVATLKRENEIWNWIPKIQKTIRVPPSMMMGSWMGSDLTNDDLVKESTLLDDYTGAMVASPPAGELCADFTPKPGAVVTWTRLRVCIGAADHLPRHTTFIDDKGREARRITYDEVRALGGRSLPARMTVTPLLEPGRRTVFEYLELDLAAQLEPSAFSLARLQRER